VGNGNLGAMVYGRTDAELIQFNEDTLWTGEVRDYSHPGAADHLDEIRGLLFEGKQAEAEVLAMEHFMSVPLRQFSYVAFGRLELDFPEARNISGYERELDLETAISRVTYTADGVKWDRHTFSSFPDGVIVHRVAVDEPGALSFTLRLATQHMDQSVSPEANGELLLTGRVNENPRLAGMGFSHERMAFAARVLVKPEGGEMTTAGDNVTVTGADAVTLILVADTPHRAYNDLSGNPRATTRSILEQAGTQAYETLRQNHLADYQPLFARVTLDLGESEFDSLPTDRRLARADKSDDPGLSELLFHYGRYLLISSSRPGSQPANLQGIWNNQLEPSWGSKYTLNINAEMNYWPAEVGNLQELHEPFLGLAADMAETGSRVAKVHYDAPGWVAHHNTDLWRGAAPINHANHGIWPSGSAWLCQHLWEHYRFSRDKDFLADRAYPLLREAARFYMHYLVEDPQTGWLISGPSNSPEHGGLVMGPTMDHQLIRSLFGWVIEAEDILDIRNGLAADLRSLRERIAPNQIGRHGQLQEWLQDIDDPENEHRHVSHLWGVFPGQDITWAEPELMEAARQSLVYRGDGGTGWALGWKLALWARFLDGKRAHGILMRILNLVRDNPDGSERHEGGGGVYPNLFGAHPPFQIDGNFGATAGIAEMLIQSHEVVSASDDRLASANPLIHFLPALPAAFSEGSVTGLRARGGFEVDLSWADGELANVAVRSSKGGAARLRYGSRVEDIQLGAGEEIRFGMGLRRMTAYEGDKSPLELAEWMMESQVSRFKEWLPEGRAVPDFWDYSLAILALGAVDLKQATGNEAWLAYAEGIVGDPHLPDGTIKGYDREEYNIDSIKPGSPALAMWTETGEQRYFEIAAILRDQMREHPRTKVGGFWHKERYPEQMWLDGLYMASPFLARYAAIMKEPALFDEVVRQVCIMDRVAYDERADLWFHGWDEARVQPWADPETGLSRNFWSRSIGWYGMALVDVLEFLPQDHVGREAVLGILQRWASGIARYQDETTGLWWQVTDAGERWGNYIEATASVQFVYTLAKAINRGWLQREAYGPLLERAWEGLQRHLLDVDAEGRLSLAQCCRVAGLSDDRDGSFRYYMSEAVVHNDIKGVGPFVRAAIELETYFND
jgi:alpha-L-fucosidase 2